MAHTTRLVAEHALEPLRGWLRFATSFNCDEPVVAEDLAREAQRSASVAGDRDLELCALAQVGASLVAQGRVTEGARCLDESMPVALALDGAPDTVGLTSCMMMTSCATCADFARVVQWVRRTIAFTERFGCPFLFAECRIHYGGPGSNRSAQVRARGPSCPVSGRGGRGGCRSSDLGCEVLRERRRVRGGRRRAGPHRRRRPHHRVVGIGLLMWPDVGSWNPESAIGIMWAIGWSRFLFGSVQLWLASVVGREMHEATRPIPVPASRSGHTLG